jgi:hypothetical protein
VTNLPAGSWLSSGRPGGQAPLGTRGGGGGEEDPAGGGRRREQGDVGVGAFDKGPLGRGHGGCEAAPDGGR